ncbi:unnamed protein product [Brassica napus]|uniref:(rape) hypothetical protein n=1 Tax=Brassica napus TaxID=3708 RepID=A0A816W555_BRANA|nr:unnamed protein product [Brassica napus]
MKAQDQKLVIPAMTVASSWSLPAKESVRVVQAWSFDFIDCSSMAQLGKVSFLVHRGTPRYLTRRQHE